VSFSQAADVLLQIQASEAACRHFVRLIRQKSGMTFPRDSEDTAVLSARRNEAAAGNLARLQMARAFVMFGSKNRSL